jgi:tetratricopeptide (TPR) repeat protein
MLYDQKRFTEAEAICTAELDAMDRVLGTGHKATVEARTILAEAALRQGDLAEAERIGRLNLAHAIVGVGPGDPATQAAAVPLVKALHASGRGTEAETILRDLIARGEAIAWRRVPDLRTARKTLAGLLEAEGRHDQAAELRSQILAACEREFGAADSQTIRAAVQLDTCVAAGAIAKGDLTAAAKTTRHGLDLATSELGVADPLAQTTAVTLARILSQSGREDEAETLLGDYLAEVARSTPAADATAPPIDATTIQKALAAILEQSGRTAEAVPLRRSILRQYLKTRGPDDNATQQAAQVLQQLDEGVGGAFDGGVGGGPPGPAPLLTGLGRARRTAGIATQRFPVCCGPERASQVCRMRVPDRPGADGGGARVTGTGRRQRHEHL